MKKILVLILGLAMSFTLYANGANETSNSNEMKDGGKKDIVLWYYWENANHQKILNKLVDDFNHSQESIVVKTEYIPFANFKKQLSIGVASEILPDMVIIDNPDHASYSAMGIFADLTDRLSSWKDLDQYYDGPLASATLNGRLYGIPFGSNCLALYYNEDMLKEAGVSVPTTWSELKDAAVKTSTDKVQGLGISAPMNEEGTFQYMPFQWSTGASSFEIDTPEGRRALTFYKDLIDSGAMSTSVINWTQGDVMNQFISGNLSMMINGPWQVPTMRKEAPDLNWNVTLIPKDKEYASVLGGENFAIIDNENIDASLEFIKYAVNPEKVKTYINWFGYIASRKDVAESQFANDPIMSVFAKQMQYAQPRGPHPRWPEISDAISAAFVNVIVGAKTPTEAAKEAQTTINKVLAEK